ncbi:hypothetical protein GCM10018793_65230 [Streptomyces sulfonofaciens]|uniref:DUF8175 domain-containing protein n=1 Tax=Streptomyces sulfonofaciens TaxID=68272 RepID=A0A919GNH2_9ACTN|nr:hypothetical protein [Streptomyces sulfonofaciens]GHH87848.1 hypothetical protein GCM10018793_65230 [Streptomyces sulfonofaciens]
MSLGDDHGYGSGERGYGGDPGRGRGRAGQTRTRLPEGDSSPYGGPRRPGRPAGRGSRSLVTIVGVVVLLIAAIAFANRGSGGSGSTADDRKPGTSPTSATGKRPVSTTSQSGIPSGFAHDEQGAQSAAANYAVALGSADMFGKSRRDTILEAIVAPSRIEEFKSRFDKAYSPELDRSVGLHEDGSAPEGYTFVSRTSPIGSRTTAFSSDRATVSVWCGGLLGLAGEDSITPVTDSWFTITMTLQWTANDWKIVTHSQKDGPSPVPGDNRASSADEIAKAVEGYGGFTYAR